MKPHITTRQQIVGALGLLALFGSGWHARAATFQGLGDLPGDSYYSVTGVPDRGHALSANGQVVVGQSCSDIPCRVDLFRWSAQDGMTSLLAPFYSDPYYAHWLNGVSADASVIVGQSLVGNRWCLDAPVWKLETIPLFAEDLSDDGSVVVGWAPNPGGISEAALWTREMGTLLLGRLNATDIESQARACSSDGSAVVGFSVIPADPSDPDSSDRRMAFRWTLEEGMIGLGDLPGGLESSTAADVSGDGSTIVGHSFSAGETERGNIEAFRWTASEGMVGLGFIAGRYPLSEAFAVSEDGSVIVGHCDGPFLWHQDLGMVDLREVLLFELRCLDVAGWSPWSVTGISADGTVICGNGHNPNGDTEAWIASVPDLFIRVESVDLALKLLKGSAQATATVLVKDLTGNPISGALVTAHWSGSAQGTVQGTTDRKGKVKFTSAKVKNATEFTLTVDDVSKVPRIHDTFRNLETTKTIMVP